MYQPEEEQILISKLHSLCERVEQLEKKQNGYEQLIAKASKHKRKDVVDFLNEWKDVIAIEEICGVAFLRDKNVEEEESDDLDLETKMTWKDINVSVFKWLVNYGGCKISTFSFMKILRSIHSSDKELKSFLSIHKDQIISSVDLQRILEFVFSVNWFSNIKVSKMIFEVFPSFKPDCKILFNLVAQRNYLCTRVEEELQFLIDKGKLLLQEDTQWRVQVMQGITNFDLLCFVKRQFLFDSSGSQY